MSVSLNAAGVRYAKSLIKRGKVGNFDVAYTADEATDLLTDEPSLFGKVHLCIDSDVPEGEVGRWSIPLIKDARLSLTALRAAKDHSDAAVASAVAELLQALPAPVQRVDISDFYWDFCTEKMQQTDEGFMIGRAAVTNIGVFPYPQPDGSVRYELRCPDEVFCPDSMASLHGKPLTNDHPTKAVKPDNAQNLQVGSVSSPSSDPYRVYCDVSITVKDAIDAVRSGKRALSCGYSCELDFTPGVWMGVRYDCIQRNIRYNHVALVDKGRAGDDAILRMDGATSVNINHQGNPMRKIRLDNGAEGEADELVILALDSAKTAAATEKLRADKAEEEKTAAAKRADALQGELDNEKSRTAELEKQVKETADSMPAVIDAAVKSRVSLLTAASTYGAELKGDESDDAIRAAVIKLVSPEFNADGKSADYLAARFDGACETLKAKAASAGSRQLGDFPGQRNDGAAAPKVTVDNVDAAAVAAARTAATNHLHNAWKGEE